MADKIPLKLSTGPNEIQEFAAGGTPDTVPIANLPTTIVYTGDTQTLSAKTLDATNKISTTLLDGTGSAPVLSAVRSGAAATGNYSCPELVTSIPTNGAVVQVKSTDPNSDLKLQAKGSGKVYVSALGPVVGETGSQTLTNKTLTQPAIGDFTNAGHSHLNAAGGGTLSTAAIGSGTWSQDRLADQGNRTVNYAYGRGNAVVIDDTTAGGSNGTARWAQRSRVAQVQAANLTVTSTSAASYSTFSTLSYASLNETAGFAFITTPDCVVDTTGGGTPTLSTTTRKGKVIRVTLTGTVATNGARNFDIKLSYNGAVLAVSVQCVIAGAISASFWTATGYITFHDCQSGAAGNLYLWWEAAKVYQAGASLEGIGAVAGAGTSVSILNNNSVAFAVQLRLTGANNAADNITCTNAIWEVLN
jgi:hypothetical protein